MSTQVLARPRRGRALLATVAVMSVATLLLAAHPGAAQVRYTVTLNTGPLIGNANGPFAVNFQLTDGSGTGDGNNTATLTNFGFGGGGATGTPTASGGARGSLTSGVTITDSRPVNTLSQTFTPGSAQSFNLALTTNGDAGPTPDQFSFALFDGAGAAIPTTGPSNAFLTGTLLPGTVVLTPFTATGAYAALGTPRIGLGAEPAVPETSPLALLGLGLPLLGMAARRRAPRDA